MKRRLFQLFAGLILYGVSTALMLRGGLGLNPWDVFHEGMSQRSGWSFGSVVIAAGVVVLLLWIPLRQRPGVGTISNLVVIGLAADAALRLIPQVDHAALRFLFLATGVALNGAATAAYLGVGLGSGPRDGLMTGIARVSGWPIGPVRTGIELGVLAAGWLAGGTVGIGTVLYALAIGPIIQRLLPFFTRTTGGVPAGAGGRSSHDPIDSGR